MDRVGRAAALVRVKKEEAGEIGNKKCLAVSPLSGMTPSKYVTCKQSLAFLSVLTVNMDFI